MVRALVYILRGQGAQNKGKNGIFLGIPMTDKQNTPQAADTKKKDKSKSRDIERLQEELSEKVGCPVSVDHSVKGKGKLTIKYNSLDELDGIINRLS